MTIKSEQKTKLLGSAGLSLLGIVVGAIVLLLLKHFYPSSDWSGAVAILVTGFTAWFKNTIDVLNKEQ